MRWALALTLLFGCAPLPRASDVERSHGLMDGLRYEVRVEEGLARMHVRVCFDGRPPQALVPMSREAARILRDARGDQGQALVHDAAGRIDLRRLGLGECVRYTVDLERAGWTRQAVRRGPDLLVTQALFLWRPLRWDPAIAIVVDWEVPPGVRVSTPWPRDPTAGGRPVFTPDRSALKTVGNVALVHSDPLRFEVASTRVEIALLEGPLAVRRDEVKRWLQAAVRAAASMYGRFHAPRVHFAIVPVGPGSRPVAFGLVRRGGGPSVMLLVHEDAALEALMGDWTAVHELSHLGLPRMAPEDRWISEGFATYYQEVLRARVGLLTDAQAWGNLAAGMERGRFTGRRAPLWRDAARMADVGRIYWAGTAFVLDADVRLRQAGSSLDRLVERFRPEWGGSTDPWRGLQVMRRLDDLFGRPLLRPLAVRYGRMQRYPDVAPLLRRLGVVRDAQGRVQLDDAAPLAAIRRAITAPRVDAVSAESPR